MKRTRTKAVEYKMTVTLRFNAAVSEPDARMFVKDCLSRGTDATTVEKLLLVGGVLDRESIKVFISSKTTFNEPRALPAV